MRNEWYQSKIVYMHPMPGDQDIVTPFWFADQEVSIMGSAKQIWPWLVQMGDGRAGWYSYDWLDNWGKRSFKHIEPSLQRIERGQKISIFSVADFVENQYLTLRFSSNANMTWQILPAHSGSILKTRLRVKGPAWLLSGTLGPGHWVMQRKQFLELKKRVEALRSE